uniref:glyceraldehyde-3-phosphate dehydrogenase (NADP(+)) (phosphorylating) n=1 Tax=Physcomitrium patens TaxID=3218 RepID=A0A7I4ADY4_PHYPA
MAATAFTAVSVPSNASLKVAGSKGLSEFSGMKSTNAVTFGKRSDDLASIVAAQSAVSASSGATRAVTEAKIKVAINGFGRIGRNFIRCWQGRKDSPLDVVVINDTGGVKQASHLLKYDSMLGTFNADVKVEGNNAISVDGKVIKGTMTTTHSYTGDQRLLDASHRDLRRARAAALNIVPTSTGAAKAVALVLPNLKGKINGIALRVPTPNVSVVDLVVQVEKKTFAEEVNQAFRDACQTEQLKGVLAVCDEPLVSVDFRCTDVSSTVDSSLTMVMGDDMVKVVAWYDNEWGYSQRVVDLANLVAEKWE